MAYVWASHVYGHAGHKWNDRADELAGATRHGKGGAPATDATDSEITDMDYMDKEIREQAGQSPMAPSGTVGV